MSKQNYTIAASFGQRSGVFKAASNNCDGEKQGVVS